MRGKSVYDDLMRLAIGLFVITLSTAAHADGSSIDLSGHLGLAAPYGLVGGAIGLSIDDLSVDAGLGAGLAGVQVGVMPRLRVAGRREAKLAVAAGASAGEYRTGPIVCFDSDHCGEKDIFTVWGNADAGLELRSDAGLLLRFYGGASVVLNRDHFRQELGDNHPNTADGLWLLYVGAALGVALPL